MRYDAAAPQKATPYSNHPRAHPQQPRPRFPQHARTRPSLPPSSQAPSARADARPRPIGRLVTHAERLLSRAYGLRPPRMRNRRLPARPRGAGAMPPPGKLAGRRACAVETLSGTFRAACLAPAFLCKGNPVRVRAARSPAPPRPGARAFPCYRILLQPAPCSSRPGPSPTARPPAVGPRPPLCPRVFF